ncbi:CoA transferase subunit A [Cloacibacillus porcorum]|jgi:acetate CoA/acetoacetate CoA-transferase alpha subunit|uniref:Branched-chain amino acid dehydrogenase n=2 Tax=Cloacibacillus porcorum TaxID=1197717 RepID=A0A1B2I1S2_9BACT|nr:CoA transferase subunit A [Cloacibacillus porcorum]ANZ43887.1 branched-chain amino acid dehydrogenase [Cloacibacillus porcorum]MCI5865633.1 CoA transferase subunit A [Cloacibacillus porcorum]
MPKKIIKPVVSAQEAVKCIKSGDSVMVGGFNYGGIPYTLTDALYDQGTDQLTLISNDTIYEFCGQGKLVAGGRCKKVIASHVGLNKTTGRLFHEGKMELELFPQGTYVEKIRAGGAGLGGFLTPTGVGTVVEEGKEVIEINGKKYILELPLTADVALVRAFRADRMGNLTYTGTNKNFNPTMATAAKIVIAEVDEVVNVGELNPDNIVTQGVLVDMLVLKGDSIYATRT